VSCWRVERRDGILYVHEKLETTAPRTRSSQHVPRSVVIVGGGGQCRRRNAPEGGLFR
jgi:hypothetical protein